MGLFDGKDESIGLTLTNITQFSFFFTKNFFEIIQNKVKCDDAFLAKLKAAAPDNVVCKIESYGNEDFGSFRRAKIWVRNKGKRVDYFEDEDIDSSASDKPCYFWEIMFSDLMTEDQLDKEDSENQVSDIRIQAVYDFPTSSFMVLLSGGAFEKKTNSMVDFRTLKEKATPESFLLKVAPYDFNSLKLYDDENNLQSPDDPDYYIPTDYYRRYSNWRCGDPGRNNSKEIGICWYLHLYDFTKQLFKEMPE